jgi:hypothetical protein
MAASIESKTADAPYAQELESVENSSHGPGTIDIHAADSYIHHKVGQSATQAFLFRLLRPRIR